VSGVSARSLAAKKHGAPLIDNTARAGLIVGFELGVTHDLGDAMACLPGAALIRSILRRVGGAERPPTPPFSAGDGAEV
jgi:hypothetical protein